MMQRSIKAVVGAWLFLVIGWTVAGCSSSPIPLPRRLAGQVPSDYRLGNGRAVIIARFTVSTEGESGLGAITNPLVIQLHQPENPAAPQPIAQNPQGLTLPNDSARVWTIEREVPTVWQYGDSGLMVASFTPGSYDGVLLAYPDAQRQYLPDSIPAPSQPLQFAPILVGADTVVYIGNIHVEQRYGFWDRVLDKVDVDYAVTDDYEASVAELRSHYPQFQDTVVEKRLAEVVTR
jgi:hypothetical protein